MSGGTLWLSPETRTTVAPWGVLEGHRRHEWSWRVTDLQRRYLGDLDGVTGGSLDLNIAADVRGTGSLEWTGRTGDEPDWLHTFLEPVLTVTSQAGSVELPMGCYVPSVPRRDVTYGGFVSARVDLFDRTSMIRQRLADYDWSYPSGYFVVGAAIDLAASVLGYDQVLIPEDVTQTFRTSSVWEPGTSYLTIANDVLDSAGYVALWADREGYVRSAPYVRPADRGVAWTFRDDDSSVMVDGLGVTSDYYATPNSFTGYAPADGDSPPLEATAIIPNDHWLSAVSRGTPGRPRWIDRVEQVEATSQSVLQAKVNRWRDEAMVPAVTADIEHAPLPIWLADRVLVDRSDMDPLHGVVETISIDCEPGALWRTGVRQVMA